MAPAALWSSWADALQMIHERLPQVARNVVDRLNLNLIVKGSLGARPGLSWNCELGHPPQTTWGMGTWLAILRVFRF